MDEMDGLGDGFGYTEPNRGKDRPNRPDRPKSEQWKTIVRYKRMLFGLIQGWMFDSVYT